MSSSILAAFVLSRLIGFDHSTQTSSLTGANLVAEQHAAVSQAKLRIAQRRLQSLRALFSLGHASQNEVLSAETAAVIAKAQQAADREFLDTAGTVSAVQGQHLVKGSDGVLIGIPGLADASEPRLASVSHLLVPVTEQWTEIANGLTLPPTSRNRSAAWNALRQRLSAMPDGTSLTVEQESARLHYELAIAEEDVSNSVFQPVRIVRAMNGAQLSGRVFNNEAQLSSYLNARRQQIQFEASAKSLDAIVQQLSTRLEKNKAIESADPVFARESQVIRQQIGKLKRRAAMMVNSPRGTQTHSIAVSYPGTNSLPPFVDRPTAGQLDMTFEATRQRVDAAHRTTVSLRTAFRKAESHEARIAELASSDEFFASEARAAGLDTAIAQAAWKQSETDLVRRRAELEFVHAVRKCADSSDDDLEADWVAPLLQIFKLHGHTHAAEQLAEATIRKYANSYDAFVRLNELGFASWKEMTGAKVRLAEARDQLIRIQWQGKACQQIYLCLKSDAGLNAPSVALGE